MREVGEYIWRQLSIWDFAPRPCIQTFVRSGDHIFNYYLTQVVEVNGNSYKVKTVEVIGSVPQEVLLWRNGQVSERARTVDQRVRPNCCIPCDHIPRRSWAFFQARDVLRGVIESLKEAQTV